MINCAGLRRTGGCSEDQSDDSARAPLRLGRRRHRLQLLGNGRFRHGERPCDLVQRSSPVDIDPVDIRSGRAHCRVLSKACPFDVSGFSLASLPGVVIGKNTRILPGA